MTIPEDQLGEIAPQMTIMNGKIVFLHSEFSREYNLVPTGVVISTYKDLTARRGAAARAGEGLR